MPRKFLKWLVDANIENLKAIVNTFGIYSTLVPRFLRYGHMHVKMILIIDIKIMFLHMEKTHGYAHHGANYIVRTFMLYEWY